MNRQQRLDWLCRNVQPCEWYEHYPFALVALDAGNVYHYFYHTPVEEGLLTRTEYLARRAELQNKPSWDDAPQWAQWLAQDSDGDWCYYPEKPVTKTGQWVRNDDVPGVWSEMVTCGEVLADWRDTLERRPEQSETVDTETQHSQNAKPVQPDDMTPPFEGDEKQESDMKIDIERLKTDRAYWDSVAPDGANYYVPDSTLCYASWWIFESKPEITHTGMCLLADKDDEWSECKINNNALNTLIPRPEPQWVDGLPSVGVECDYTNKDDLREHGNNTKWYRCCIVAYDNGAPVIRTSANRYHARSLDNYVFRPIPSPRDAWVTEAQKHCTEFCSKQLGHVYDALVTGELEVPK